MPIRPKHVVLLAAGMGTRLGELGGGRPKALFEVAGRVLLDRALDFSDNFDGAERVVVGGFRFDLIERHMAGRDSGGVKLVENTEYRIGNLRTVETGLPAVSGDFLLMNIDHIYPPAVAERIGAMAGDTITAMGDFDRELTDDDMKVKLVDGKVQHISKKLTEWDAGYVGMTFVPASKLARYRKAIDAAKARYGDSAVAEQVLQILADEGEPVVLGDISGIGWSEVDTPEDYERALAAMNE